MRLHKFIKPVALTCALTANICSAGFMQSDEMNYNFVTVKAGLVAPAAPLKGNSNLNTGNNTYTAGILVGRKMMDRFSVDMEYMFRGSNTSKNNSSATTAGTGADNSDSWSMKSDTLMLSFSVDLLKDDKIRPYVRAGAGISSNKSSNYTFTTSVENGADNYTSTGAKTNSFAYQVGFGLAMSTSPMFDTQIEYMYVNRGKVKAKATNLVGLNDINGNPTVGTPIAAKTGYIKDHVVTLGIKFKF